MDASIHSEEAMAFFTLQRLITATSLGEMYNVREDGKVAFQKMDEFEELVPELAKFQPLRGCQHVFPRVLNNMRGI